MTNNIDPKAQKSDIVKWLDKYQITHYTIQANGVVDVEGDVDLKKKLGRLEMLPIKFGHVAGSFSCAENKLVSLEGVPNIVEGNFDCHDNRLASLAGSPNRIGGNFTCRHNKLTSLNDGPTNVGGDYCCAWNKITALNGAPRDVKGEFNCSGNILTSLKGGPDSANAYDCYHCHL